MAGEVEMTDREVFVEEMRLLRTPHGAGRSPDHVIYTAECTDTTLLLLYKPTF